MWFSFWRSRNRFSLEELRYLTDQLQKVQIVNEVNKDFVIEALRSIAELVTYGDQHDPSFFEFFMEKQIMGEFVRILRISRPNKVALQLLQTMSIMIQNLRSEHAIYYIFSNEHINSLITYSFDFQNEELLSYYISFLRAVSGKLNKNTISLLVKTQNEEVISFPLYVEAIRFAFHEESMVRIAVRALTLNVYHVGDECVNRYVSRTPLSDYFSNMVRSFWKQCANLDELVSQVVRNTDSSDSASCILAAVDEIEDNLYYFSDIISAGVPDLGRLITDNMLHLLVFPLLLPSLEKQSSGAQIGITTSLYLLCCILHIFKSKELASVIAATLFYPPEVFVTKFVSSSNGYAPEHRVSKALQQHDPYSLGAQENTEDSGVSMLDSSGSAQYFLPNNCPSRNICGLQCTLREVLLSYVTGGNDLQVLGSLSFLATLLQTKDGLGILPQRKQHKKLLLQALVGEDSGEEQLFSLENSMMKDSVSTELDRYLHKLVDHFGLLNHHTEWRINSELNRSQVLDALVSLFCRSDVSADILWAGGWLLRQLLPHGEEEFTSLHLKRLKDSHKYSTASLLSETKGRWCDLLVTVLNDEWKNCKRAIEASLLPKNPKSILLPSKTFSSGGESSFTAGERMCEMVKVFVLQRQLLVFSFGGALADLSPVHSPMDSPVSSQVKTAGLDVLAPKPGCEINLVNAVPCRIAFERGKERHFCFLALSRGTSGWILLAEELPLKQQHGIVRVTAPLAGSDPRIDEKHSKWLHLRIRPSTLPFLDPAKYDAFSKGKSKILVDGRWTLAFRDEQACKTAESMIIEGINLLCREVEERLKPLLELDIPGHAPEPCTPLKAPTAEVG
ncbi:protein TRANSPARENT TESTA 9-like isoform X2 [Phoenix dactylifera]|uniref:Protein TRANSPARENT TESTA 9-like isoform X2 n=1 Tax=Phoenix dactylifera TaxID=42345 RepID=A0A8B9AKD0_PHODC|nr:protein TRANSPARENT TESTA 9-like isoform X2 [Phoenix dactylifera]